MQHVQLAKPSRERILSFIAADRLPSRPAVLSALTVSTSVNSEPWSLS